MGILDRMSRLIRANINDMIDRAEDPEKMLNELLREMESGIKEARVQVANMIAQQNEIESELQESQQNSREWERRAELAVQNNKDDLAREALRRKRDADNIAMVYAQQATAQQETVDRLKQQLKLLEAKYNEAEGKRDVLIARHRATQAQRKVTQTLSTMPGLDTHSELDRMEKRIRSEEAQTRAMGELQGDSLDYQFSELDRDGDLDNELAALKARVSGSSDAAGSLGDGSASSSAAITSGGGSDSTAAAATAAADSGEPQPAATSDTPGSSSSSGA
jgi:phage shock protein A